MTELRFYVLRVLPQREKMVRDLLIWRGHKAFIKTERRLRRKTKRDKVRTEQQFIAASGYVFLGSTQSPWPHVHNCHLIRSVVSLEGRPVIIDPAALGEFLGFDDFDMPDYFAHFHTRGESFSIGDMVRIDTSSFDGLELRVKDIQRGEAVFDLIMLGRSSEIRVPLEQVFKAA